ncbi:dipeptide ABC transporter ATP-binding protein [Rhizobium rhizogenes]|uniref:ABC transporter ATP-binding protein n=1 Tax=Rhizobium rhizogenes NBRC 13257 TaxID=1220581 RepID=A0AA87U7B0_RHIRH|nr:ABC transporter ATP-binding protein [Rhizobium rhizogenes]NTG71492.1 ABC transporter ATP-binding protein [Rhizobium rhizogenes]NTG90588.1 ABC transporter ATP-binding protein [Rhizobium rhizogenes]TRB03411.1 ABC transporter ATP-binding protein [Rhizobium rhizogenes]TRB38153.1 ABC transporter ATP-binding protein [Rhizobium rhizogenes]TRB53164.1 ABC transporter ATP-binding protein [Rhizobium rhizogenes]
MNVYSKTPPLLEVRDLTLRHKGECGPTTIVRNVSFDLGRGEVLGIIGESGAGKSTIGNAVIGLLGKSFEQSAGTIRLNNVAIETLGHKERQRLRGRTIASVFQDHTSSLDPLMTVGAQLSETISTILPDLSRKEVYARAIELLGRVGISDPVGRYHSYPHQLSGGQRQRVVIATALAGSPSIIVADEPTSALDATVQKQILDVLRQMADDTGLSLILITHDMGVIAQIADKVLVMKDGEVVEHNSTSELLESPQDAYTRSLLAAVPRLRLSPSASQEAGHPTLGLDGTQAAPILIVENLSKTFNGRNLRNVFGKASTRFALENLSLEVARGGVLGIVGESGSGKTTIGRILAGLETGDTGNVILDGEARSISRRDAGLGLLGHVQMIFQDPSLSLNPRMTVAETLSECLRFTARAGADCKPSRVTEVTNRLGLAHILLSRYPHQLSGGQKQRVSIARALLAQPALIIADEPTSALDVSVQAEIIALLKETIAESNLSMIFISHDLAVVQDICDTVCIMKDGRMEDFGPSDFIFGRSENSYTRRLINARPTIFTH